MSLSTVEVFKHIKHSDDNIEISGSNLVALQRVLAGILMDIDSACEASGVRYALAGGTCLGAVRHQGFIPWDDDVDLLMPHSDFDAFAREIERLFPGKYTVQIPGVTPGYDLAFPRVRLNGTVVRSRDDIGKPQAECGAYVDIFYVENVPDNKLLRKFHGIGSMAVGLFYSCRRFAAYAEQYLSLVEDDPEVLKLFARKARLGKLLSFWSAEQWTKAWDNWNSSCKNFKSTFMTVPVGRNHYFKELHQREVFFPAAEGSFDGFCVSLPGDFRVYLTKLYGSDYMVPPTEGNREVHVVYEFDLGEFAHEAVRTNCMKD